MRTERHDTHSEVLWSVTSVTVRVPLARTVIRTQKKEERAGTVCAIIMGGRTLVSVHLQPTVHFQSFQNDNGIDKVAELLAGMTIERQKQGKRKDHFKLFICRQTISSRLWQCSVQASSQHSSGTQ